MLPVTSLNSIKIGNGKRGKNFNKLLSTWSQNVGVDIEKQIKEWNSKDKANKNSLSPYNFKSK